MTVIDGRSRKQGKQDVEKRDYCAVRTHQSARAGPALPSRLITVIALSKQNKTKLPKLHDFFSLRILGVAREMGIPASGYGSGSYLLQGLSVLGPTVTQAMLSSCLGCTAGTRVTRPHHTGRFKPLLRSHQLTSCCHSKSHCQSPYQWVRQVYSTWSTAGHCKVFEQREWVCCLFQKDSEEAKTISNL